MAWCWDLAEGLTNGLLRGIEKCSRGVLQDCGRECVGGKLHLLGHGVVQRGELRERSAVGHQDLQKTYELGHAFMPVELPPTGGAHILAT